ncbi:g4194 [Coccomyxa elongata]
MAGEYGNFNTSAVPASVDIMGFSCRFPESESPTQFWENLVAGTDMVTENDRRWPVGLHGTPGRFGKLVEYHLFDAPFFSVHGKQASKMDPQMRKLLEVTHEAFVDSGIDYKALRGSPRVGVYLGCCGSEVHAMWLSDYNNITGYEQTGCTLSMFANRLSFFFDFKGPSKAVDTACSSAFLALHDAVLDLQRGRVDYAVVGGSSAIFRPATSLAFLRLKMLSPDGACKSFDASGNGYARAEGVASIILRRSDVFDTPVVIPREPYARVLGIGTNNDGHTEQGITFPSGPAQQELGTAVCRATGVDPSDIQYVEAHGTGTVVGDSQELSAIDGLYGAGAGHTAEEPLLIGSVKSNMGHCEGCSGLAGLIKVCLSYENGLIPGNLHYKEPNPNNESLKNGVLKVVTGPTPWQGGLVAISSFGFGGSNVHAIIAGCVRPKGPPPRALPVPLPAEAPETVDGGATVIEEVQEEEPLFPVEMIIPICARTQEGSQALLEAIKARAFMAEEIALPLKRLANHWSEDVAKLGFRGTICNGEAKWEHAKVGHAPPIWFVFSGNGSQWPKMAEPLLLSSPVFLDAVRKCADALRTHNVDLMAEFAKEDGWKSPALAMVGLVAVQIGLVDMLRKEYGIVPAGMLGHSAGEIPCGYADGCLTREQTILIAYHRGRMAPDNNVTGGLMAAVGLSADAADARLRKEGLANTVVGCDNSPVNVTLAGPAEELAPLCAKLKDEGVFVRELDTLGIPYHSPALEPFSDKLRRVLTAVVGAPKERSAKWLSTCYPLNSEEPGSKLCGPDYHVQSYKSRVLFKGACAAIPEDAVLLEIGPHGIMRAPLRQNCAALPYVGCMKKGDDATLSLREAVAGLWRKGAALKWAVLEGPVPELPRDVREKLVSWNHTQDYETAGYQDYASRLGGGQYEKVWDLGGDHKFLADHVVDGRILMPATSYVVTAWEALCNMKSRKMEETPVAFEDVQIRQAVTAEEGQKVALAVLIAPDNRFNVLHSGDLICEGFIKMLAEPTKPEEPKKEDAAAEPIEAAAPAADAAPVEAAKEETPAPATESGTKLEVEAAAPSAEAVPAAEGEETKKEEPKQENPGDKDELWMHKWGFGPMETIQSEAFYRMIGRTGITYGDTFRMVKRVASNDAAAMMRWDQCWVRLLDGMLQLSVAGTRDYELRIPTRIRSILINCAAGSPDGQIYVTIDRFMGTVTNELATVSGLELTVAPRRAAHMTHKTITDHVKFVPYGMSYNDDPARIQYMSDMKGYCKAVLLPCFDLYEETKGSLPKHLAEIRRLCLSLKDPCPEGEAMEAFLANPDHVLARVSRDISRPDVAIKNLDHPMQAIVAHEEHDTVYVKDPACRSFSYDTLKLFVEIILENMPAGFRVLEAGAGTGGLTKDALPLFETDMHHELLRYCATDITSAFSGGLLDAVKSPKLIFKNWDINEELPTEVEGPFHVAVATNVLHTGNNLKTVLTNIYNALHDNGFLLFFEMTTVLPTLLWGLDAQCWNFEDEREFGLWVDRARWERLLEEVGFAKVSIHTDEADMAALFLYRKLAKEPVEEHVLMAGPEVGATADEMKVWLSDFLAKEKQVAGVKDEPKEAEDAAPAPVEAKDAAADSEGGEAQPKEKVPERRLWLYGSMAASPGTCGLYRTARTEPMGERLRLLFNGEPIINPAHGNKHDPADADAMLAQAMKLDLCQNVFVDGKWGTYKMVKATWEPEEKLPSETQYGAHMDIGQYGDLNTLRWVENEFDPAPNMLHCEVIYGALNFKDVMLAYGKLNRDMMSNGYVGCKLGFEFSGMLNGRRIMGVAKQAIATHVFARDYLVWDIPKWWSLRDAATVPVAYLTAYYALVMRGGLEKGHKVLVHSGTGAVGLAAIRICLHRGCEVFTTCGSDRKKAYLLKTFPGLREDHIGNSRSTSFEHMVMHQTKGEGVHLCLNSLADDKLLASVRCLAANGHLLEIGKYDILKGTALSMRPMHDNITFHGINLDSLFKGAQKEAVWDAHKHLSQGMQSGEVQPLPWTVYSRDHAQEAFRFLAGGTHMGKVLIQVGQSEEARVAAEAAAASGAPAPQLVLPRSNVPEEIKPVEEASAASASEEASSDAKTPEPTPEAEESTEPAPRMRIVERFIARDDRTYLITGGLGGFGLALAVWLVGRGAKKLVLSSKRGLRTGEQMKTVQMLQSEGALVEVSLLDCGDREEAAQLLADCQRIAPLAGIFHLAMVLEDRLILNHDGESWNRAIKPKAVGAWNLHELSQPVQSLEHFIVFSSVVSSIGHQGQANYGYANAAVDSLCQARRMVGMPALSVQWGPIADVGFVAEIMKGKLQGRLLEYSTPQPIDECLAILGDAIVRQNKLSPVMSVFAKAVKDGDGDDDDGKGLVEMVMELLGIDPNSIGEDDNLAGMGIDSMQVVEVRARIQRALGRPIPLEEIGSLTLRKLRDLEKESGMTGGSKEGSKKKAPTDEGPDPDEVMAAASTGPAEKQPLLPAAAGAAAAGAAAGAAAAAASGQPAAGSAQPPAGASQKSLQSQQKQPKETVIQMPPAPKPAKQKQPKVGPKQSVLGSMWWSLATGAGMIYLAAVLCLCAWPVIHFIVAFGFHANLWILLPVIPAAWLVFGVLLMSAAVVTKHAFQPPLYAHRPIPMYGCEFFRWWLVQRMTGLTTVLFADQLRGTPFLVGWFRALGARIGRNVYIDSVDLSDFDLINIGDDVAINEGATLLGHYFKDGLLHFGEVIVEDRVRIEPYAAVLPGSRLEAGAQLKTLRKSRSKLVAEKKDPMALMKALGQQAAAAKARAAGCGDVLKTRDLFAPLHDRAMHPCIASILQLATLYLMGVVMVLCAYLGYTVTATILEGLTLGQGLTTYTPGFAAAGIIALLSPMYLAVLPVMSPALMGGAAAGYSALIRACTKTGIFGFLAAFVAGFLVYGLALTIATILLKWLIVQQMRAGTHKRHSWIGVRFWASQRLVENAFRRFVAYAQGTWLVSVWLRCLGARIGSWVTFRFCNVQTAPDMLNIGDGTHVGDMANMVSALAIDADTVMVAPIEIGKQVVFGVTAVIMPGTILGDGAVLGAIAAADIGQELGSNALFMGVPAIPTSKHTTGPITTPKGAFQYALYWVLPALQPAITLFVSALGLFIIALAATAALHRLPYVAPLLLLPALWLGLLTFSLLTGALLKWVLLGRGQPTSYAKYSWAFQSKAINASITDRLLNMGLLEAARASWWHSIFLRGAGAKIGRGVYFDTITFSDFDLLTVEHGVAIDRNACVFCHVGIYRNGAFIIDQARSTFGANSVVGARAATVMGYNVAADTQLAVLELGFKPVMPAGLDLV